MKEEIYISIGVAAGAIAHFFFGNDLGALKILLVFMAFDILAGGSAAMLGCSTKSEKGFFSALAMWRGLRKKIMTLVLVSCAHFIDEQLGTDYVFVACIWAFMANELFSILETYSCTVSDPPQILKNMLEILRKKEGEYK